jgi:lysophospholipase
MAKSFAVLIFILLGTIVSVVVNGQGSYAPINSTCPASLIRSGTLGISSEESTYVSQRSVEANQNLKSWLQQVNLQDFDLNSFFANKSNLPVEAIAFSGGGYRAMLNGAGVFQGKSLLDVSFCRHVI